MADTKTSRPSTAQAAYQSETVEAFSEWLQTEYQATDAKTGALLTDDKTGEPIMRLPSVPSASANISPEWAHGLMHHPMVAERQRYEDGDLSTMTRYGVYLALADKDGRLQVPKALRQEFADWLAAEEARKSAAFSAARQAGAEQTKALRAEATQVKNKLSALEERIQGMLVKGLITQELADAMLAGDQS